MHSSSNHGYADELMRISSFSTSLNHFINHSVLTLARDGFYNPSKQSNIKCYSCGYTYDSTTDIGDPIANHRRESPSCDHIRLQHTTYGASNFQQSNGILVNPNSSTMQNGETSRTRDLPNEASHEVSLYQNRAQSSRNNEQNYSTESHSQSLNSEQHERSARYAANHTSSTRGQDRTANNAQTLSDFRLEYCRRESFHGWPSNAAVSPDDLANAGFYYLGTDDKVQCAFCKGILRCWEPDDRPLAEHLRHFPTCEFLMEPQSSGNVPLGEEDRSMLATVQMRSSDSNPAHLTGILMDRPVNPRYANVAERLSSFSDFPSNSFQKPANLANAGFYYTGEIDTVKCFFCNIIISDWQPNSDPWLQHAKASNRCGYVIMNKGEDYVRKIKEHKSQSKSIKRIKAKSLKGSKHKIDEKAVDRVMTSHMVKSVAEMGDYSENLVRAVIEKRFEELGSQFPNAEALVDGIVDYLECQNCSEDEPTDLTVKEDMNQPNAYDSTMPIPDPEGIFESSKDSFVCKVCLDNTASIVFLKCGHLVCCNSCAPELTKCPICREKILGTICVDL